MMKLSMGAGLIAASALLFSNCSAPDDTATSEAVPTAPAADNAPAPGFNLPDVFDCVRETGTVLIAAHRGGPQPGFPENALETMQKTFAEDTPVLEIDVSTTADGQLFLFHDRTLGRLTGEDGTVAVMRWSDIRGLELIDNDGQRSGFTPTPLEDALNWAVEVGAILELDRKDPVTFNAIIDAVGEANAEANTILITYNAEQASEVARLAPDLMMTASAVTAGDVRDLERLGVDRDMLIAWTGTRNPSRPDYDDMEALTIEAAFGTLGRPGNRLDDHYRARDYAELVDMGVRLIATDRPADVARFLDADDRALEVCLRTP